MSEHRNQILKNIVAFAVLFIVSLYRQLSLRFLPNDPFRTYILYACYVLLISIWIFSITLRVTQKSIQKYLIAEVLIMLTGLTIRFLQDTFWTENILLMRGSGLFVGATLLPIMLFGLYAALCIGKADEYRIQKKWYWLIIPVALLLLLNVTDEWHHFVCYIIPEEPQPNLYFHPYIGFFLIYALALAFAALRVAVILKQNHAPNYRNATKILIAFIEPILLIIFTVPYLLDSLLGTPEVIEFYAKIYYIDIITWELYIYLGLVPTNGQYYDIFRHSTVAMQIIEKNGKQTLSLEAEPLPEDAFERLLKDRTVVLKNGVETHLHEMDDAYFVWNEDLTFLRQTIDELNQTAEILAQEGTLLEESVKTKSEEAEIAAKSQIYDALSQEVRTELQLMKEITMKRIPDEQKEPLLRQLCILGTYVKRRCNLRLIQKEHGEVPEEDLRLSIQDLLSALDIMMINSEFHWAPSVSLSTEFSIYVFDMLEYLLEYERFEVESVAVSMDTASVNISVFFPLGETRREHPRTIDAKGYTVDWLNLGNGYRLILSEGGDIHVPQN